MQVDGPAAQGDFGDQLGRPIDISIVGCARLSAILGQNTKIEIWLRLGIVRQLHRRVVAGLDAWRTCSVQTKQRAEPAVIRAVRNPKGGRHVNDSSNELRLESVGSLLVKTMEFLARHSVAGLQFQ